MFIYQEGQKLSKAPVVEAVIELRVATAQSGDIDSLVNWRDLLKDRFPRGRHIHFFQAQMGVSDANKVTKAIESQPTGVRLESDDGKWVVQGRLDALSVSRLAPYTGFEDLVEMTKSIWKSYVDAIAAQATVRLGVRYINRIEIKADGLNFDTILTAGPKIPSNLPQLFTEFMSRVVVQIPEQRVAVAVLQAFDPGPPFVQAGNSAIVLDIDAFSDIPHEVNSGEVWRFMDTLRRVKNLAFFSSLTPGFLETLL